MVNPRRVVTYVGDFVAALNKANDEGVPAYNLRCGNDHYALMGLRDAEVWCVHGCETHGLSLRYLGQYAEAFRLTVRYF